MRKDWLLSGAAAALIGLLALAWIVGGDEPLRPIAEPVSLPEMSPGANN